MRYFILKQSKSLINAIKIPNIAQDELNEKSSIVKKAECGFKVFLNLYEKNVLIVSGTVKMVLEKYDESISCIPLVITNDTAAYSKLYWIIDINKINNETEEIKKIKFGIKEYLAVDLKIAEEILRNLIFDIDFEEIEIP